MSYQEFVRRAVTFVLIVVLVGAVLILAVRISSVLVIAFLCWIISVGLGIPINFFRRRGMRRPTAMLVTFLLTALVVVLFTLLILPPLVQQTNSLLRGLPSAVETVIGEYARVRETNSFLGSVLPPFTPEDYQNLISAEGGSPPVDTTTIARSVLPVLADIGGFLGNVTVNLFLITFISIYFVLDPLVYYRIVLAVVPRQREQRVVEILNTIRDTVVTWLGAMVLEVTITAVMVAFALGVILRVPNAAALGALAGLGNIVPYIGYWAALIPILIFAAASGGTLTAVLAFVFYFVIGIVEANIILPANVGSKLKLPAGLVLLFQAAAGALLGFWGVLLALPLLAILMVLTRELIVFDALGKRGRVPRVSETGDGRIVLDYPPYDQPPDQPAQPSALANVIEDATSDGT